MKHGQISNHLAPAIGFNIDNLLFKGYTPPKLPDNHVEKYLTQLVNTFKKPVYKRELDKRFVKMLIDIWDMQTPYSIYLYTRLQGEHFDNLEEFLYEKDIRFSRLFKIPDFFEFQFVVSNQLLYFFDRDDEFLSNLGSEKAQNIRMVGDKLGLRYTFPEEGGK